MSTATLRVEAPTVRAAVYARISKDDEGDALGVKRQERDCRALAARKGWEVDVVFIDDDVSAYTVGKRPAYGQLISAIVRGDVDAVIVYDLDRLHRHPAELETFFQTCDRAGLRRLASVSGDVDLASNDGQFLARIMGAVAKKSSDDTSRRLKRKKEELAEGGQPAGSHRAFAYEIDGRTIRKDEAKLLREAAQQVLRGESLTAIAKRWNAAGIRSGRGAEWSATTLRSVLTSPRQAGLRVHRGEIVGTADWPAVLDRAT